MSDRIEKSIELKAPLTRVWRALTDYREFGEWFKVQLDSPFVVGRIVRGLTTYPGYEGMRWEAVIVSMDHERLFAFEWCPYSHDEDRDFSEAPRTRVEFRLEATATGTRLDLTESGFDRLPDDQRRIDALRMNAEGWDGQLGSIAGHVES